MRKIFRKIDRRFQFSRPGSVLILVVALLVLMALIGTAFLSTTRVDRIAVVQHTNNTEIDLLLEGVKNMAKATIVGSLNDPSLPFPYRPANSTLAKNWDAPDMYHQYTTDPLIGTTPNDAWLSPRCPTDLKNTGANSVSFNAGAPIVVWPCIGEPLTGNTFESPFVEYGSGTLLGQLAPGVTLTYTDRITGSVTTPAVTVTGFVPPPAVAGNLLMPTFVSISYPNGTSATFPAFTLTSGAGTFTYLAGDADGDGIADCGMFKLPVGQIDGLTYYAGVRIIDNCAAVNVNTAMSRRYDLNGSGVPTRYVNSTGTVTYSGGVYNLGCFESNVGLAELLASYDGYNGDNASGSFGSEFAALTQYRLNNQSPSGVVVTAGSAPTNSPYTDTNSARTDFAFTTLGDLYSSQIGRRPSNPGQVASGYTCLAATDADAAELAYHFVFNNPNASRTPLELALHNSLYDISPNSNTPPPWRTVTNQTGVLPGPGSNSYSGTPANAQTVVNGWYVDNFDWANDFNIGTPAPGIQESCLNVANELTGNAGQYFRSRRSIFTAGSAVSNLAPQPLLPSVGPVNNLPTSVRPFTVATGMSQITSTLCKASINTATFPDLWRAFWLGMTGDYGLSPLGSNSGATSSIGGVNPSYTVPAGFYDHDLVMGQSIYTGSQFANPVPPGGGQGADPHQYASNFATSPLVDPQHPQEMFRSSLRNPSGCYYQAANTTAGATTYSYIEADQMVLLRSAIAAANVEAMRDPLKGNGANIHAHDITLNATLDGAAKVVTARVFGVTQQPYITEVYANTNTSSNLDVNPDGSPAMSTQGQTNAVPYVAIELFNPYNTPIDLKGWQIAQVDRNPTSDNNRGITTTSVIYTFGSDGQPTVMLPYTGTPSATGTTVYQGSYALIDDLGPNGATYRPISTGLPATGSGPVRAGGSATAGGPLIYFSVPNLNQLIPNQTATPAYAKQELVLLRPATNSGVAETPVIDQVPVDSFDFTGLTYGDTDGSGPTADVWHYARGNVLTWGTTVGTNTNNRWRFIYPGRYDASDPTPYRDPNGPTPAPSAPPSLTAATGGSNGEPRTPLNNPAYVAWSRRQQGTEAGHFHPTATGPTAADPFDTVPPQALITLGVYTSPNFGPNDNPQASYPVTFPFQYLNNDEPGASPLLAGVNAAPFGQFARNSDILQVPFVGSYIIFSTPPSAAANGTNTQPLTSTDAGYIIEMNAMPIDCSFAEDTDLTDDPPWGMNGDTQASYAAAPPGYPFAWSESVGHFAPVNTSLIDNTTRQTGDAGLTSLNQLIADSDPTLAYTSNLDPFAPYKVQYTSDSPAQEYWRYHWASRIFDYLTVQNPNDDFFPNVQQAIYSPPSPAPPPPIYGPQPLPVQNTASITTPGNSAATPSSYTEDTVPVYGLININTAPWRVLSALRLCPFDDAEPNADLYTLAGGATPGLPNLIPDNTELAGAIVTWRDLSGTSVSTQVTQANPPAYPYSIYKGPFTSTADLLNVPVVQAYLTALNNQKSSSEPDDVQGHFLSYEATPPPSAPTPFQVGFNSTLTPPAPLTDGVRNDVEERFDLLNRLSNQITVKSDVYTVYIVIQGWRNAGSTSASNPPQLVTQKRAAFIIDRTGVTPTSSNVKIINVPTN